MAVVGQVADIFDIKRDGDLPCGFKNKHGIKAFASFERIAVQPP